MEMFQLYSEYLSIHFFYLNTGDVPFLPSPAHVALRRPSRRQRRVCLEDRPGDRGGSGRRPGHLRAVGLREGAGVLEAELFV